MSLWLATAPAGFAEEAKPHTAAPSAAAGPPRPDLAQTVEADVHADELAFTDMLAALRVQFRVAVASVGQLPQELHAAIARETPDGSYGWLGSALLSALLAIGIGYAAAILLERWWQRTARPAPADPEVEFDTNTKIAFLLRRLLVWIVGSAILVAVGLVVLEVVDTGAPIVRRTALIALLCVGGAWALLSVVRTLFTPTLPQYRLVHVDSRVAGTLYRDFAIFVVAAAAVIGIDQWFAALTLPLENRQLVAVALSLVPVLLLAIVCACHGRTVSHMLVPPDQPANPLLRGLARGWWVIAIAYFVVGWLARCVDVLLGRASGSGLVVLPILLLIAGFVSYGVARLLLARMIAASPILHVGTGGQVRRLRDFRDLAYDTAAWAIVYAALIMLLRSWGASFESGGAGSIIAKIGLIVIAGFVAYDAVRIVIDRKLAREGGLPVVQVDDEAAVPLQPGQSRLATLLPLARLVLLSTIVTLIVMMVLSELGVQVAPLLAGASIFGLAIGFGSQTLVHDILSGAFFLVDDAFRVGEYVDLGGGIRGTVEKISIRSFQLRHQNGPLHTIQFGNLKQVTNYSRDWALTKIPFKLALGTDIEKVRKIIKKVGQELMDDPTTAPLFLTAPKSQGLSEVSGNGITIRAKYMTRPTDSSLAHRAVLSRLHQAFLANKIEFQSSAVTVRIESDPAAAPPSEAAKLAAATAAAQADGSIPSS
ncbi:MAG: mechanosensitive ion channel family protein [Geminicoccaceae bacterium]